MLDTPESILKKQFEVYSSKSLEEKFRMLTDMMEYGVKQTQVVLKQWYPNKSEQELKIEFFKIYYKDDFGPKEMNHWLDRLKKDFSASMN